MKLVKKAIAGTMESSDFMITIAPTEEKGIKLDLQSSVMQQYGKQIEAVIKETLAGIGVDSAEVVAIDKGALDCTIRARVGAAAFRAAESTDFAWEVRK
jgi:citrate lyase subunit gamma (acyl carrier protein)